MAPPARNDRDVMGDHVRRWTRRELLFPAASSTTLIGAGAVAVGAVVWLG